MASVVEIYNRALAEIGTRSTVASPAEQSPEARACNLFYGSVRDQVLRAANWNFAKKTATLSLLKSQPGTPENPDAADQTTWSNAYPPPQWLYSYAYPSDCSRVQRIMPQVWANTGISPPFFPSSYQWGPWGYGQAAAGSGVAFRFEVATDQDAQNNAITVILCNVSQAIGVYTQEVTETSVWDADFTEAVVFGLAGRLAVALTGNLKLAQLKYQMANQILTQARVTDANEGMTVQDIVPDWIAVRGGTSYSRSAGDGWGWQGPYGPLFGGQ